MQPSHQDEPTDQREGDASRHHSDTTEGVDDLLLSLLHLEAFEVLLEHRCVSLDELSDPDADGDQTNRRGRPLAPWMDEDRPDGRLRRVVRWRFAGACEKLKREKRQRGVGDATPRKPQPLRDPGRVIPAVEGVEDGAHEAPDRVGADANRHSQQKDPSEWTAGEDHEAAGLVGGRPANPERNA